MQNLPTRCGGFAGRRVRLARRGIAGRGRLPQAMSDGENRCAQWTVCGANLDGAAFRQPRAIPYSQFKTESMASKNACTSSAVV